jgi:small subunit ribosomal protein S17
MPKRILQGVVVSDKTDKTVVVRVERSFLHPLLKKTIRRTKKYHAHDESNSIKVGEKVRIIECPPKSKLKTWEVVTGA